jgi:hypothetical protein
MKRNGLISLLIMIFLLMMISFSKVLAQAKKTTTENYIPALSLVLTDASFGTTTWSLSIQHQSSEYLPITHQQYTKALDSFAEYLYPGEYRQALKYRSEMKEAFKWFTLYCDNLAIFLPNASKRPIPFRFADKDGKKCVLLTDLASSTVYNTLRTTSNSRASKVLTACLIPKIKYFYEGFQKTDFAYFGLTIVYGSKDFSIKESSPRSVVDLKAEMLAFITSKEKCRQFSQSIITESEFIDNSDVYLTDRDMTYDLKKVRLQIE